MDYVARGFRQKYAAVQKMPPHSMTLMNVRMAENKAWSRDMGNGEVVDTLNVTMPKITPAASRVLKGLIKPGWRNRKIITAAGPHARGSSRCAVINPNNAGVFIVETIHG